MKGISLEYVPEIFKEFTSEITTFMYPKPPEKIEETIAFIEESMQKNIQGSDFVIVIIHKDTGEFLGCGGLHEINTPAPELGIWIKKSAHGHGYGKEAIFALKNWADQNLIYEYLLYPVAKENYASRKIPESMGAVVVKESDFTNMQGVMMRSVEYRIYPEKKSISHALVKDFLGKKVYVIFDRPKGTKHPKHGFEYEVNYGFIPNTKSPDGEELDAYFLGTEESLQNAEGVCIAIIHRENDDDDKLIIVPEGVQMTDEEIMKAVHFQEQWFTSVIIRS